MPNITIHCSEPANPRYIYINTNTNTVHLLVPFTSGTEIALDNTCRTVLALQQFFGKRDDSAQREDSARFELMRYKKVLEDDIMVLPDGSDKRLARERLAQVEYYIAALANIEPHESLNALTGGMPTYPSSVLELLRRQSNQYSMRLRPTIKDSFLKIECPMFSVNRDDTSGTLYHALMRKYQNISRITATSHHESLCQRVWRDLLLDPTITSEDTYPLSASVAVSNIYASLVELYQNEYGRPLLFSPDEIKQAAFSLLGVTDDAGLELEKIESVGDFRDFFGSLMSALKVKADNNVYADPIYPVESPFNAIKLPMNADNVEKLSIMTQFLLAEINFYTHANNLIDGTANFGQALDRNNSKAIELADAVSNALAIGLSAEDAVINFINNNCSSLRIPLRRPLTAADIMAIKKRFLAHYICVQDSPHMDEFMTLDLDKKGHFFTHQGSMCFDFSELTQTPDFLAFNTLVFDAARAEINSLPTRLAARDAGQIAVRRIDIDEYKRSVLTAINQAIANPGDLGIFHRVRQLLLVKERYETQDQAGGVVTKNRSVFEKLDRAFFAGFDENTEAKLLFINVRRAITDAAISNSFNRVVCGREVQLMLTPDMVNALYTHIVATNSMNPSMSTCTSVQAVQQLLNSIRINSAEVTAGALGNFVIDLPQRELARLQPMITAGVGLYYLTPRMEQSLYKAVVALYGENNSEVINMMGLNNVNKLRAACRLLDITLPEDITFPNNGVGTNSGYIIRGISDDTKRVIQETHALQAKRFRITQELARALYQKAEQLDPSLRGYLSERDGILSNLVRPDKLEATLAVFNIRCSRVEFNDFNGYWAYLDEEEQQKLNVIAGVPRNVNEPDLIPGYRPSVSSAYQKGGRGYIFENIIGRYASPTPAVIPAPFIGAVGGRALRSVFQDPQSTVVPPQPQMPTADQGRRGVGQQPQSTVVPPQPQMPTADQGRRGVGQQPPATVVPPQSQMPTADQGRRGVGQQPPVTNTTATVGQGERGFFQANVNPPAVRENSNVAQMQQFIVDRCREIDIQRGQWVMVVETPITFEIGMSRRSGNLAVATREFQIELTPRNNGFIIYRKPQRGGGEYTEVTNVAEKDGILRQFADNFFMALQTHHRP